MTEMGRLVDHQGLDLVEHRRVGGIGIAAIGAPGCDDPDRRFGFFHRPDLDRGGMGAQDQTLARRAGAGQIERVVHLARGMFRRNIEGVEIVKIVFDIGAFGDGKAHLAEDRDAFVHRPADRMETALRNATDRQRDVDCLLRQTNVEPAILELGAARLDRPGDRILGLI